MCVACHWLHTISTTSRAVQPHLMCIAAGQEGSGAIHELAAVCGPVDWPALRVCQLLQGFARDSMGETSWIAACIFMQELVFRGMLLVSELSSYNSSQPHIVRSNTTPMQYASTLLVSISLFRTREAHHVSWMIPIAVPCCPQSCSPLGRDRTCLPDAPSPSKNLKPRSYWCAIFAAAAGI